MRYVIFSFLLLFFYSCENADYSTENLAKSKNIVTFNLTGDTCSSTIEEISSSTTINSTTSGFSNSFLAPNSCSDSPSPDKIYKIILDSTKKFTAEIFNSDLDSVLYLKRSCESDAIICNDDKNDNDYQSKISAVLEAGEYYLIVDGYGQNSVGSFELKIDIDSAIGESCTNTKCKADYKCEIQNNTPICICNSGNCDTQEGLAEGDITINEFMANPSGSDRYNEWVELKNNTNNDISIENLKIMKDSRSYVLNSKNLVIKANSYFLIVKSPNVNLETYDAIISNLSLSNSATHTLTLLVNDVQVDQITYNGSSSGVSSQFDGTQWCKAKTVISANNSDKATPLKDNTLCGDLCSHNCNNHGVCNEIDGSCECNTGYKGDICNECETGYELNGNNCDEVLSQLLNERDIIITEFMPNPEGSDTIGEYIELYNRTDQDLSLDGLKIIGDDSVYHLPNGYTIDAKSHFVIGKNIAAAAGNVDAVISSMSFNNTGEHIIILELDDLSLDIISYTDSVEGKAKQLDRNQYDNDFDDLNWCDKDSTPKLKNLACVELDYCENINCNNGECINGIDGYTCICQVGYTGDNCDSCDGNNPDCDSAPISKSIIITEIMINPDGSDNLGEWIEIYNTTNNRLKLQNVKIQKDDVVYDVTLINDKINPHSYFLISRNLNLDNVGGTATFNFNNIGTHNLTLFVNSVKIDSMTYNDSVPTRAFQLDVSVLDADGNDDVSNWCYGRVEIANLRDKGTPGAPNRGCGGCAAIECPLNSHCELNDGSASCFCETGYELDNNLGICVMTEQCGVLYDNVRSLRGEDLRLALQQLTGQRYNPIKYSESKEIMYREIDIDENHQTQCVYTGRKMTIIDEEPLDSRNGNCDIWNCECGNKGMNTEHTWPQSKFDKQEPMKGDLHHLFPTDACTNSMRSSFPFGKVLSPSGIFGSENYKDANGNSYGYSKLGNGLHGVVFEPPLIHKGDVARAMFYFIVRYGNYSNFLDDEQEAVLRQWAHDDPVSEYERIRNTKIEKVQWNRNPFVDCPQFLDFISNF